MTEWMDGWMDELANWWKECPHCLIPARRVLSLMTSSYPVQLHFMCNWSAVLWLLCLTRSGKITTNHHSNLQGATPVVRLRKPQGHCQLWAPSSSKTVLHVDNLMVFSSTQHLLPNVCRKPLMHSTLGGLSGRNRVSISNTIWNTLVLKTPQFHSQAAWLCYLFSLSSPSSVPFTALSCPLKTREINSVFW